MTDQPTTPLRAGIVPVTPFEQNCTLIWDEATKIGAVVDPGGDVPRIQAAIKEVGLKIEKILLTHGHLDHVGGAAELAAALGVKIEGPHVADKFLMEGVEKQAAGYGLQGLKNATSDRWLNEGDALTVAGHAFEIFHCPGHSPGSLVYVNRTQRIRTGRRRVVSRLDRPNRLPLWRPRGPDRRHQIKVAAARRRHHVHLRPRPRKHLRR